MLKGFLNFDVDERGRKKRRLRGVRRIAPMFDGGICERLEFKRKRMGIPQNTDSVLRTARRKRHAADIEAKRPREPRWLQREKRLAAKAALKKAQAERDAELRERVYAAA
jgi:hypothetical protein